MVNSEKHIVQQCIHSENIQININEMAMAYLGIPLIRKEHNVGSIVIGPFYCYGLSEKILFDIIDQVDMKEEGKKYLRSYWRYLPCYHLPYEKEGSLAPAAVYEGDPGPK
ncbi:MAG TPA: hypothetical protein GXX75_14900 [Clostridiales bacterium]|nr:hypothetical protein [Clostridiales bacterium]